LTGYTQNIFALYIDVMSVIILLIIVSLLLASGFLCAFIWSVNDGQMEDEYTPSVRMLFDTTPVLNLKKEELTEQIKINEDL